jgi:hypothetical protein
MLGYFRRLKQRKTELMEEFDKLHHIASQAREINKVVENSFNGTYELLPETLTRLRSQLTQLAIDYMQSCESYRMKYMAFNWLEFTFLVNDRVHEHNKLIREWGILIKRIGFYMDQLKRDGNVLRENKS